MPYAQTFAATGGTPPYTGWAIVGGAAPGGLSLSTGGVLSGTPSVRGTFTFSVRVTDTANVTGIRTFDLTIDGPGPTITTTSPLSPGTVGLFYTQTFSAIGGTPPYVNWAIVSGVAPPGLSLNSAGLLSGTPTVAVNSAFTVRVTDFAGSTTTKDFSLFVEQGGGPGPIRNPLTIVTDSGLPPGTAGTSYSFGFQASGGVPPYRNWRISGGTPPPGLSINGDGVLSGPPGVAGTYLFTVSVDDSATPAASTSKSFSVIVSPPSGSGSPSLLITTAPRLPPAKVGTAYSLTFQASGGTPPYVNWTGGGVPGLTLTLLGTLSGTPQTVGEYTFDVRLRDSNGVEATKTFLLVVTPADPPAPVPVVIISQSPLAEAVIGTVYRFAFGAEGGTPPYRWVGTPPPGLTLNSAGVISGTPDTAGTYDFKVEVVDDKGATTSKDFRLVVRPLPLTFTSCSSGIEAFVGAAYSAGCSTTGGTLPYAWAIVPAGAVPGLSISAQGVLSGTPNTSGTFQFTVRVTDASGNSATQTLALTVTGPPAIDIEGIPSEGRVKQQIPFVVTLAREYPVDITGVATLSVSQDAVNPAPDTAVQFATGGTSVRFTIPARTTRLPLTGFQTGSVAGTFTVTLGSLQVGAINITGTTPSRAARVRRGPPQIDSVRIERSGQSAVIVVTGLSNPRQVTRALFRFVKAPNASLATQEFTVEVDAEFTRWFRDPASAAFGSTFVYRQPFTIQGDLNVFTSVTITLTNAEGPSEEKGP